jgi:cleavage and polyadenylation specificity factor subunit 5
VQGLKRKLATKLAPTSPSLITEWDVGECVATYWRPNHAPLVYPYLPAHITKPKEVTKLYIIPLPERCYFAVPRNMQLIAVPMFELYQSVRKFGPFIAAVPEALSRFRVTLVGGEEAPAGPAPQVANAEEEVKA